MKKHRLFLYLLSATLLLAASPRNPAPNLPIPAPNPHNPAPALLNLSASPSPPASNLPASGITFIEGQWNAAKQKAIAENKYIFVDAYTTWCGPCKQLKRTTFKDPDVADFFNDHFINVSLNVEKGEGTEFASRYNIQAVPTLIIFTPSGRPVLASSGYLDPANLLSFGHQALEKGAK
ncbi:MAG: thioredoxin family protein [Bacteroidetes bacterium]|nr:thioredoxin family protein [Bacteroidota bacterium]